MLVTNLKQLRAERGMDQAELAALVGVRRETINRAGEGPLQPLPQAGPGRGPCVRKDRGRGVFLPGGNVSADHP